MSDHQVPSVALAYFGYVDPAVYGVNFSADHSSGEEQYVAVSSYFLDGMENRMVTAQETGVRCRLAYEASCRPSRPSRSRAHDLIYSADQTEVRRYGMEPGRSPGP